MRGYVVKKGQQYYAVIYGGIDPATGKERRRWHPGGPKRRDAERLVNELVKRRDDGEYVGPDKTTLGEYLTERWLPGQRSQLRPSTFDSYERNVRLHVLPRVGATPLQKLTAEDLDRLYAALPSEGRRNGGGGGLSPKTVRLVHLVLQRRSPTPVARGPCSATSPSWPTRPSSGPLAPGRSGSGRPGSCGRSSRSPPPATATTPPGSSLPTPGCAGARFWGCGGSMSTSTAADCRCAKPSSVWPTGWSSPT